MNKEIKKYLHILPKDGQSQKTSHMEAKKILKADGIIFEEKETDDIQNEGESMDYLYGEAKKLVKKEKRATAVLFQRKLQVGYMRAANLLDMLEENGIIGPADGAKPRKVLESETEDAIDELYIEAKQYAEEREEVIAARLGRKLKVSYARAEQLLNLLEQQGIVGPADGIKPRKVLV